MWRDLGITKQEWEQTPPAVRTVLLSLQHQVRLMGIRFTAYEHQIADLRQQIATVDDLKAEIAELRERLGQNSSNSSKPPSSDPPSSTRKPASEPKGRQRGAQPGHQGKSRNLKPVDEVDTVIELRPASCQQCGDVLRGDDPRPTRHQVSEIPRVRAEVTEYRRHTLRCLACGTQNQAAWPKDVPAGSFGPRVQATVGYLTGRLGASHRDAAEVMEVMYGLEVGLGSVAAIQQQVSGALAEPVEAAQQFVEQQKAQYVDETGWQEGEQQKWLWINATSDVTAFNVLDGRSSDDARQVISRGAKGVVATDRYAAYNWLAPRRRQICWAHLARDFQALVDRGGDSAATGQALLKQVKRLFALWPKVRGGELSREEFQRAMKPVRQQVKKLLQAGTRSAHPKTRRTCTNIVRVEQSLWTFVRVEDVEPTNNAAERGLRRAVLWRRKSFGTQSITGSRFVGRILTTVTTLRQQGRDVLDYLTDACCARLGGQAFSGLVPDSS